MDRITFRQLKQHRIMALNQIHRQRTLDNLQVHKPFQYVCFCFVLFFFGSEKGGGVWGYIYIYEGGTMALVWVLRNRALTTLATFKRLLDNSGSILL